MNTYRNVVTEILPHTAYFVVLVMISSIISSGTNTHFVRTRCVQYSIHCIPNTEYSVFNTLRRDLRLWDAQDRRLDTDIPTVASTDLGLCPGTAGMPINSVDAVNARGVYDCAYWLLTVFLKEKNFHFDQVPRRTKSTT